MKTQFNNIAMTSMLFWFDNKLLTEGEAFTNYSSYFWPISTRYYGYYTYGAPFKQMVIDESISGADIISGVYVSGVFTQVGQNFLSGINASQGQLYFSQPIGGAPNSISGDYAVKDFNIYLTSETEEDLLFETQFQLKPQTFQNPTGLPSNAETYPVIYLKYQGGANEPFAFGGMDTTYINVRAIVLSDNIFKLDAVTSIFRDTAREFVPLVYDNQMPFNMLGSCTGECFNYKELVAGKQADFEYLYIDNVSISKTDSRLSNSYNKLNPNLFTAFIDFELSQNRYPRQ